MKVKPIQFMTAFACSIPKTKQQKEKIESLKTNYLFNHSFIQIDNGENRI